MQFFQQSKRKLCLCNFCALSTHSTINYAVTTHFGISAYSKQFLGRLQGWAAGETFLGGGWAVFKNATLTIVMLSTGHHSMVSWPA